MRLAVLAVSLAVGMGVAPRFEVVTVLPGTLKISCEMMASAVHNDVSLHVVGWGDEKLLAAAGAGKRNEPQFLKQKILLLVDYLKDWPGDTVVAIVDGSDVLFQAGMPEIRAGYKLVATEQRPIVFSAQRHCVADPLPRETCDLWPVPERSPYRYLCSGVWAGPVGRVLPLLEHSLGVLASDRRQACKKCDPGVFAQAYMFDGWNTSIALDYQTDFAVNVFGAHLDFGCSTGSEKWRTCPTGRVAPIFHLNVLQKKPTSTARPWLSRMPWTAAAPREGAEIRVNGALTPLGDLCPGLWLREAGEQKPKAGAADAGDGGIQRAADGGRRVADGGGGGGGLVHPAPPLPGSRALVGLAVLLCCGVAYYWHRRQRRPVKEA